MLMAIWRLELPFYELRDMFEHCSSVVLWYELHVYLTYVDGSLRPKLHIIRLYSLIVV